MSKCIYRPSPNHEIFSYPKPDASFWDEDDEDLILQNNFNVGFTGEKNGMFGNGHLIKGKKNGMYGKKHTKETREKMSKNNGMNGVRYNHTEETKQKISKSKLGSAPTQGMTGKKHSEATKQKIREALLRRANNCQ